MLNNKGKDSVDVCLVSPPMSVMESPSFALSLLKATLNEAGISSYVDYADIYFNHALGIENCKLINGGGMTEFGGEYVFCESAGITPKKTDDEIEEILRNSCSPLDFISVKRAYEKAKKVAKEETIRTVDRILSKNPKVVGITSCFQQRNAALSICRRIKELAPEVVTMMGGANCFGRAGIGMLRCFPFVDYVFFGESDDIFADVCRIAMTGSDEVLPFGVLKQGEKLPENAPHRIVMDMNKVPAPDYDDYLELSLHHPEIFHHYIIPFGFDKRYPIYYLEGSRGCWWGEKHPCTFCGLNGQNCRHYRSKTGKRVYEELINLQNRYGAVNVCFTDCIMPMEWFDELLPQLREHTPKMKIFIEVKSNLNPEQMELLADAGIVAIQPGIESLSDHALSLMNKGVTGLQNISILKSSYRYGIKAAWNILTGFPGETVEDYKIQAQIIPYIEHLQPPGACSGMIIARDNEYATHPEKYGLELVEAPVYDMSSPDDPDYIADIALYYDTPNLKFPRDIADAKLMLEQSVRDWKNSTNSIGRVRLDMTEENGMVTVSDTRTIKDVRLQYLFGTAAEILVYCNVPRSKKSVIDKFVTAENEKRVSDALSELMGKKLLIHYDGRFLSLPVLFKPDEFHKREVEDFCSIYTNESSIKSFTDSFLNDEVLKYGNTDETVLAGFEKIARTLEMDFSGEDYRKYSTNSFSWID